MKNPTEASSLPTSSHALPARAFLAVALGIAVIVSGGCFGEDAISVTTGTTAATTGTLTTGTGTTGTATNGTNSTTGTAPAPPATTPVPAPPNAAPPANPPGAPPSRAVAMRAPKLGARSAATTREGTDPFFFAGHQSLGNDVYFSPEFGYYYLGFYFGGQNYIYKYGFGYLYYAGDDGADGDYFYDFESRSYLYTSDQLYDYDDVTYFYSFDRRSYLFYYEDLDDANARQFYDFGLRQFVTY